MSIGTEMPKRAGNRVGGSTPSHAFTLTLADGTNWAFSADGTLRRQLGILGRVMTLRKGRDRTDARILLLPAGSVRDGTVEVGPQSDTELFRGLPGTGWKARAAGQVICWYHAESPDTLCEIPGDMTPDVLYPALNLSLAPL